jgi:predicted  nucleic acid-binding Zn-ribbon protein
MESTARDQIRDAKRIELERRIRRLQTQVDILDGQIRGFEKEVEAERANVESIGRSTVSIQMLKAEVDTIEQVLHSVAVERETLIVELQAGSRVRVLGDPNSPADMPEDAD